MKRLKDFIQFEIPAFAGMTAVVVFALFAFPSFAWKLDSNTIFEGEGMIDELAAYACDGANISPDLYWGDGDKDAKSYALVMKDQSAPGEHGYYHWIVVDIPTNVKGFTKGEQFIPPIQQIPGDSGTAGYYGPCPPKGSGKHFYTFTLYSLNVEKVRIVPNNRPWEVHEIIKSHAIHNREITATFERK